MSVNPLLKRIACRQRGYFTASQAVRAGYSKDLQRYYVSSAQWVRIDRSVYRLIGYSDTLESQFIRWALWAIGRDHERLIAISHESALYYYGLLDEYSIETHVSISSPVRRMVLPHGCVLHYNALTAKDYIRKAGFNITTPHRTLCDLRPDLVYNSRWLDTVQLAEKKGLIDKAFACELLGGVLYQQMLNTERSWAKPGYAGSSIRVCTDPLGDRNRSNGMNDTSCRVGLGISGCSEWRVPNRSFTLVEMLVVIAIMSILMALLMPALNGALSMSKQISCTNNLKQFGAILPTYSDDYGGYIPICWVGNNGGIRNWAYQMMTYTIGYLPVIDGIKIMASSRVYMCPSSTIPRTPNTLNVMTDYSYQISFGTVGPYSWQYPALDTYPPRRLNRFLKPGATTAMVDGIGSAFSSSQGTVDLYRHNGRENYLFLDGHAESSSFFLFTTVQLDTNKFSWQYSLYYR